MSTGVTNPNQFSAHWRNAETGEMEPVSDEVYAANRLAVKKERHAAEAHAAFRGDRYFK
jgi:hypothetical protein